MYSSAADKTGEGAAILRRYGEQLDLKDGALHRDSLREVLSGEIPAGRCSIRLLHPRTNVGWVKERNPAILRQQTLGFATLNPAYIDTEWVNSAAQCTKLSFFVSRRNSVPMTAVITAITMGYHSPL